MVRAEPSDHPSIKVYDAITFAERWVSWHWRIMKATVDPWAGESRIKNLMIGGGKQTIVYELFPYAWVLVGVGV